MFELKQLCEYLEGAKNKSEFLVGIETLIPLANNFNQKYQQQIYSRNEIGFYVFHLRNKFEKHLSTVP